MLPAITDGASVSIEVDAEAISQDIIRRMQEADSFEAAFTDGESEVESWQDYLGVPVFVQGYRFNKSKKNESGKGPAVYAVVNLSRADDGEELLVSTGSKFVLVGLVLMVQKGWTDKPVKLTSTETGGGNTVLRLVPA